MNIIIINENKIMMIRCNAQLRCSYEVTGGSNVDPIILDLKILVKILVT